MLVLLRNMQQNRMALSICSIVLVKGIYHYQHMATRLNNQNLMGLVAFQFLA